LFNITSAKELWYALLSHFVNGLRGFFVQDPRDHLYAEYGLANHLMPRGIENPLSVDYGVPTEELWTWFNGLLLEDQRSLYELSLLDDFARRFPTFPLRANEYNAGKSVD
jgi:hypothetical protein